MSKNEPKIDIAVLKTQVQDLRDSVNKIETNHLPHIQNRLDKIENKMAYYAGALAVLSVILKFILK